VQRDLAFLDGKLKRAEATVFRAVHPLDIANPHYRTCSILSQNADNSLNTLGVHDRMALIRHYPPKQE
jgi:hypothetical protein